MAGTGIKFTKIAPKPLKKPDKALVEKRLRDWAGRTVKGTAKYPPAGSSSYRRTGTLGRKWQYRYYTQSNQLVAEVFNTTPYAPYVQDAAFQSRLMASRGWQTVQTVGTAEFEQLWEDLGDILSRVQ